jgi:hypothetical protein
MLQRFEHEGISFQYPAYWQLEQEPNDSGWSVSLQSPGTAFLFLSCDDTMPTTEDVAETALEALKEEYPDLEAEPRLEKVAGQMAIGHDVQFFQFDLTNSCWTRSFYSGAGTALLMCQVSDVEEETYGPMLRAICASLQLEDD